MQPSNSTLIMHHSQHFTMQKYKKDVSEIRIHKKARIFVIVIPLHKAKNSKPSAWLTPQRERKYLLVFIRSESANQSNELTIVHPKIGVIKKEKFNIKASTLIISNAEAF